ncbi:hypothetical protein S58_33640 [Bradyrhizobium oligotrophicum S58]|uniref:Uncharacterized protein n=1 Tax=Bradyrhizobium oligotrophicum S58 TaxID=1245469 RepID=M4ZSV5_9BRAD|nr:hypothetical protein S58_33640 [Bradyrhizobium oligotrophicum S58]
MTSSEAENQCLHVIASEAKQSRVVGGTLDCFVASLLAMTKEKPYPAYPAATAACGTATATTRRGDSRSACSTAKVSTMMAVP